MRERDKASKNLKGENLTLGTETLKDKRLHAVAENGILIVGAGLAGLSLSLALAKMGERTTVLEKQKEISPSKWAILVYPQGLKFFDEFEFRLMRKLRCGLAI